MIEKIRKEIGKRLKEAVKTAGLTAKDVAEALGLSNERSVSQWYRGEREIRPSFLAILSEKFKINPAYVLAGYGAPLLSDIAAMDSKKKPSFSKKEEEIFRERHPYIVAVLENVFEVALTDFLIKAGQKIQKVPEDSLRSIKLRCYCLQSLWRFFWALTLKREPLSTDIALVGVLYFRENDFFAAAERLKELLGKDWPPINKDTIRLESSFFEWHQISISEPDTLRLLRFAAYDLIDLYLKDELPSFCLAHYKVYWTGCPICKR